MANIAPARLSRELMAIVPGTNQGPGRGCRLLLADGSIHEDKRQVRAVLTALARFYAIDLVALRQRCSRLLRARNYLPLPLAPDLILVPLALGTANQPTGYVNLGYVTSMEPGSGGCKVFLGKDSELLCFQSFQSMRNRFLAARAVLVSEIPPPPGITGQKLEMIRAILARD